MAIALLAGIMIFSWRIHADREMGEERRLYLHSVEGKDFDAAETRAARKTDPVHGAILWAALTVSAPEAVFTGILILLPFRFGLFWLIESRLYVVHRRARAQERMRK